MSQVVHATVVAEQDSDAILETLLLDPLLAEGVLFLRDGDTSDVAARCLDSSHSKPSPPAPNLEKAVCRLELALFDDKVQLVELGLIKGVGRAVENTRRIHPRVIKEEAIHVIAKVVVLVDVLPAPLNRIRASKVSQSLKLCSKPVRDSKLTLGSINSSNVLGKNSNKLCQIIRVILAIHVALPKANISVVGDPRKELGVMNTHASVERIGFGATLALVPRQQLGDRLSLLPRVPPHHLVTRRQNQPHTPLVKGLGSKCLDRTHVEPVTPRHIGGSGARLPRDHAPHSLHHSNCRLDAILVETIATPGTTEPDASSTLDLRQPPLGFPALIPKHGVAELELPHSQLGIGCLGRVEGHKEIARPFRKPLQGVDPVGNTDSLVARATAVEVREVEAVPRSPNPLVLGHQSNIPVQVDIVECVRHSLQHLPLCLGCAIPQNLESHIRVRRKDNIVVVLSPTIR
mmetsp:Transcript_29635/g.74531  ORF Transcript_29635/g.74531 Transcript_29635/m.74531 type:complete len:460 (+) Transcript_29635:1650-3029(+)